MMMKSEEPTDCPWMLTAGIFLALVGLILPVQAATESVRVFPGTLRPVLDVPLRDTAITRVEDVFYLTGTQYFDHKPREEIGINIWRSKDLKQWDDLGLVWRCDDEELTRAGLDRYLATRPKPQQRRRENDCYAGALPLGQ